jgi:aconitate hydratase
LAPGKAVTMRVKHAHGATDEVMLKHSLNQEQIEWFKAGSALNMLREKQGNAK